ncbi:MAG: hypothetical protein ACK496_17010 [Acidobacteriota bacterium]
MDDPKPTVGKLLPPTWPRSITDRAGAFATGVTWHVLRFSRPDR